MEVLRANAPWHFVDVVVVDRPLALVIHAPVFHPSKPRPLGRLLEPEIELGIVLGKPDGIGVVHQFLVLLHRRHSVRIIITVVFLYVWHLLN